MNRLFFILSFLMGVIVLGSNYLVQFPVKYYGLEKILTYGAFSYPIAFLITDISNRFYGKIYAKKIVYIGFAIGICFSSQTFFLSILWNTRYSSTSCLFSSWYSKAVTTSCSCCSFCTITTSKMSLMNYMINDLYGLI